jgi:hypothetical protein
MEQRSIALYLSRKGAQPAAVHRDIVATLGPEAVSYSSVIQYLRDFGFASSNPVPSLP